MMHALIKSAFQLLQNKNACSTFNSEIHTKMLQISNLLYYMNELDQNFGLCSYKKWLKSAHSASVYLC